MSDLLTAVQNNQHDKVVQLIENNGCNDTECDALCLASTIGNIEIVKELLRAGADVNAYSSSALYKACDNGNADVLQVLIDAGGNIDYHGDFLTSFAIVKGYVDVMRVLVRAGVHIGNIALYLAANHGQLNMVQYLLDKGCVINATSTAKNPITIASQNGHTEVVKELIRNGADISDEKIIREAVFNKHVDVVKELLRAGADVNPSDSNLLQIAATRNDIPMTQLLLSAGADVNKNNGEALRNAARNGHNEIVKLLLQSHADVHACEDSDDTIKDAIYYASIAGYTDVMNTLIRAGANINACKDKALCVNASHGRNRAVDLLLELGADIHTDDDAPIINAIRHNQIYTAKRLMEKYVKVFNIAYF